MLFSVEDISGWWGVAALVVPGVVMVVIAYYQERIRQMRVRFDLQIEKERQRSEHEKAEQLGTHNKTLDTIREKVSETKVASAIDHLDLTQQLEEAKRKIKELEGKS